MAQDGCCCSYHHVHIPRQSKEGKRTGKIIFIFRAPPRGCSYHGYPVFIGQSLETRAHLPARETAAKYSLAEEARYPAKTKDLEDPEQREEAHHHHCSWEEEGGVAEFEKGWKIGKSCLVTFIFSANRDLESSRREPRRETACPASLLLLFVSIMIEQAGTYAQTPEMVQRKAVPSESRVSSLALGSAALQP